MSTLLHINSSPLYGRSVSRQLTGAFVTQWKSSHPDGTVVDRDLSATPIPPITAEWVGAAYTPEKARTPQQKELLTLSDTLLSELEQPEEYVLGVPMHNFGVPSVLKLWIDQVARVGRTFSYADGMPKGLLTGKKATFIIATGGIYDARRRCPLSTLSSRICGRSLASSV
jgi:FMN-dependent NADH-azoreductase